jgi:Ca2+-binding EF-hand superfamily protein
MKKALFAGIAAAGLIAVVPAFAQPAAAPSAPPAPHARMDGDHTRAEVAAKVQEHFAKLDSNRDGFVTKAEADAMRGQIRAKFADNRSERSEQRKERTEMRREHSFERIDTNNDGSISRAEFDAAHARRDAMAGRNGDGMPDHRRMAGAMRKMHAGMGGFSGRMFEMADANKDGRVSLQEAQAAALQHFDTADLNHDGRITREERMQRVQQVRTERRPG